MVTMGRRFIGAGAVAGVVVIMAAGVVAMEVVSMAEGAEAFTAAAVVVFMVEVVAVATIKTVVFK